MEYELKYLRIYTSKIIGFRSDDFGYQGIVFAIEIKGEKVLRICHHCKIEMLEGFDVKIEGSGYGIKISKGTGMFAKRLEKPKVAICPQCGEVSIYLEHVDDIR